MAFETSMLTFGRKQIHTARWTPDGDPRAVVAIAHGIAEHVGRYRHVGEVLAQAGHLVVATDHLGHGRSDGTPGLTPDLGIAGDVLVAAVDATDGIEGVPQVILGHSLGSAVAGLAALRHQGRWTAMVLSGTVLAAQDGLPGWQVPILTALAKVSPKLRAVPALDAEGICSVPAVVQAYREDPLVDHGKPRLGTALALLSAVDEIKRRVGELTLPTLLLHGEDDALTPISGAEWLLERSPAADKELKVYPGLHEVFNEIVKEQVLGDLVAWLDGRV